MTRLQIFTSAAFVTLAVTATVLALRSPEIGNAIAIGELAKSAVETGDVPVYRLPTMTIVAKRLTPEEVARMRAEDAPEIADASMTGASPAQ